MAAQLEFTMKSGAVVTVDVETFTLKRMAVSGARSLEWTDADETKTRRLVSIELDEVAAVVEVTK